MKDELLKLVARVSARHGWSDRYIGDAFGQSNIVTVLRNGKHGPGINTAERFKVWLLEQLDSEAAE